MRNQGRQTDGGHERRPYVAGALEKASKDPADKGHWALAAEKAGEIHGIEKALFGRLAGASTAE